MRYAILILLLSVTMLQLAAALYFSYWTIAGSRVKIADGTAIGKVELHIRGAERVVVKHLPEHWHWAVSMENNLSGEFRVTLLYWELDSGKTFNTLPFSTIVSEIEITSGLPLNAQERHDDDYRPDRSKKVNVSAEIIYDPAYDPKKMPNRHSETRTLSIKDEEITLEFHNSRT